VQADAEHFESDARYDEIYHLASPASGVNRTIDWFRAELKVA